MKKKELFQDLSQEYECQKCGKSIKTRLVRIKSSPPKLCYQLWMEAKGKGKIPRVPARPKTVEEGA